jgi:SAM-dependent methyltransferase
MDWEQRWREGDAPWDHGEASPPLVEFLDNRAPPRGEVLVPGCGSGHDVRALAGRGFSVTGLDISPSAIDVARQFPASGDVSYLVGDWLQVPAQLRGRFDWVVEHTCFCAIDPQRRSDYVESLCAVLKRGGSFLAIFYMQPEADSGPPYPVSREELDRLFSENFKLIEAWEPEVGYQSRLGRELCCWYQLTGTS